MAEPLAALRDRAVFEQALKTKPLARSEHFALHHCQALNIAKTGAGSAHPMAAHEAAPEARLSSVLSTNGGQDRQVAVDNSTTKAFEAEHQPAALSLGLVVPKRHAKRAVTRNTIKRQARALGGLHREALAEGVYVLRLKAPFGPPNYIAATSDALRTAVRHEIDAMFAAAITALVTRAASLRRVP